MNELEFVPEDERFWIINEWNELDEDEQNLDYLSELKECEYNDAYEKFKDLEQETLVLRDAIAARDRALAEAALGG